jgi:branched-subunit amino acid transport protein
MGAVTYLTRFPALWLGGRFDFSSRLKRGLSFMPVGIFAAMIVPPVLVHTGDRFNLFLPAAVAALGVAWFTKKPLWSMLAGVATLAALRAMLGS